MLRLLIVRMIYESKSKKSTHKSLAITGTHVGLLWSVYVGVRDQSTVFTLSTMSTTTIEEVSQSTPGLVSFFQLHVFKDREVIYCFLALPVVHVINPPIHIW